MKVSEWQNCYNDQWTGLIVPEAFSHPAKFAPGLIKRIYEHCIAQGYVQPGQIVLDCFAGISGGGIFAPMFGLQWYGIELEEKFVSLSNANFKLHERKWKKLGKPIPQIIQGDSRRLSAVLSGADLICTSPPFVDSLSGKGACPEVRPDGSPFGQGKAINLADYGHTEGQLGAMKAGDISAVVCSPPFSEDQPCASQTKALKDYHAFTRGDGTKRDKQMRSSGNIGNLPAGKVENVVAGIVTSPPFESTEPFQDKSFRLNDGRKALPQGQNGYGHSSGQIGQESGNTYWEAVRDVYAECFKVLKLGGVLVVVVKSYVKAGRRVPLPMQTLKLLIHLGFEPLERIKAMLVKTIPQKTMFGIPEKQVQRKSFFRRLAENRGSPEINWEEVLIVRKTP